MNPTEILRPASSTKLDGIPTRLEIANSGRVAGISRQRDSPLCFDIANCETLHALGGAHASGTIEANLTSDGLVAVTVDDEGNIFIWLTPVPQLLSHIPSRGDTIISSSLAGNGEFLLLATNQLSLVLVHLPTSTTCVVPNVHTARITSCVISGAKGLALSSGLDGTINCFQVASADGALSMSPVFQLQYEKRTFGICLDQSHERAVFGDEDGNAVIVDLQTRTFQIIPVFSKSGHYVAVCAFNVSNTLLAVASHNGNDIHLIDLTSYATIGILKHHSSRVTGLAFADDTDLLISIGLDGFLKTWLLRSLLLRAQRLALPQSLTLGSVSSLSGSGCSPLLRFASIANGQVYSIAGGETLLCPWPTNVDHYSLEDVKCCISSNGSMIFAIRKNALVCWNAETAQPVKLIFAAHPLTSVDCSSDGSLALTGTARGHVLHWRVSAQRCELLSEHTEAIIDSHLSDDGTIALTLDSSGKCIVWDTIAAKPFHQLASPQRISCCSLSDSAAVVVTCDEGGTILLWDTRAGTALRRWDSGADAVAVTVTREGYLVTALSKTMKELCYMSSITGSIVYRKRLQETPTCFSTHLCHRVQKDGEVEIVTALGFSDKLLLQTNKISMTKQSETKPLFASDCVDDLPDYLDSVSIV